MSRPPSLLCLWIQKWMLQHPHQEPPTRAKMAKDSPQLSRYDPETGPRQAQDRPKTGPRLPMVGPECFRGGVSNSAVLHHTLKLTYVCNVLQMARLAKDLSNEGIYYITRSRRLSKAKLICDLCWAEPALQDFHFNTSSAYKLFECPLHKELLTTYERI